MPGKPLLYLFVKMRTTVVTKDDTRTILEIDGGARGGQLAHHHIGEVCFENRMGDKRGVISTNHEVLSILRPFMDRTS
jgi:hypothetical protein